MGYNDGAWGWGQWLAMGATMLVFWGSVIALIVWAVRRPRSGGRLAGGRGPDPDEVLAARFARGDISEDEFRRHQGLLHDSRGATRYRALSRFDHRAGAGVDRTSGMPGSRPHTAPVHGSGQVSTAP